MAFINQFPYSDFHEMNLDWLIKHTKDLEGQITALQDEFSKIKILSEEQIKIMIEQAIEANNIELYNYLTELKAQITNEYTSYIQNQIQQLTIYIDSQNVYYDELAKGYADEALTESKNYTDTQVLNYTMMINPINGEYQDVREVVEDIITYFHSDNSLTAAEYDALDLTAQAYDNYEITAFDYDFDGKNILV